MQTKTRMGGGVSSTRKRFSRQAGQAKKAARKTAVCPTCNDRPTISPTCAMPKPPKAVHTEEGKIRGQYSVGKLQFYEILFNLNQGFEQVRGQLQQLEKLGLGHQPWNALRV